MPEFDVIYKFSVIGVRTVDGDTPEAAALQHEKDIVEGIEIELGDGAMLESLESGVYDHNDEAFDEDVAEIQRRIDMGTSSTMFSPPRRR